MNFNKLNLKSKKYIKDLSEEELQEIIETYRNKWNVLQNYYNKSYAKGMAQAYFDMVVNLKDDIPILEINYEINTSDFQKGFWQGQLELARILINSYNGKMNEIDKYFKKGESNWKKN